MSLMNIVTRAAVRKPHIQLLSCSFHKTSIKLLDDRWRELMRLTKNPNAFGPLTNMPDYSFKDGRPTPYGIRQMIRINRNRDYYTKIQKLTGEIDHAVDRHAKLEEQKALEKQKLIDRKLKPKGYLL